MDHNKEKCYRAVDTAKRVGATESAASVSTLTNTEIHVRNGTVEYIDQSFQEYLDLKIYIDGRFSSHYTNIMDDKNLENFVINAVNMTRFLSPDKDRSLPDPSLYPENTDTDIEINDPDFNSISTEDAVIFTKEIDSGALTGDENIISVTSEWNHGLSKKYIVHSNGFEGERISTYFSAGAEVTARDGDKSRPEDYFYASARFKSDLPDLQSIGKNASERALKKLGQRKIESGTYTVVVENRASRRLVSPLISAMNAKALHLKSSFLNEMKNKMIASEKLMLTDDPLIKRGLGSRLFDSEGLAAKRRVMIDKGVLKSFYTSYFYSKKTGFPPTSYSLSNLIFKPGKRDLNSIINDLDRGILITNFIGGNANNTTGDFSMGIQGFLIDSGKIVHPVNEMNISGNLISLWKNLTEVGNDPFVFSSIMTPSLVFASVDVSGL